VTSWLGMVILKSFFYGVLLYNTVVSLQKTEPFQMGRRKTPERFASLSFSLGERRRKIRLIESNAKCRYLKRFYLKRDFAQ
jgi:hypothetical protein